MEKPRTILVVDRSEPIRVLLTAFFSREGFAVDSAATFATAFAKLRCAEFDVVLLDPASGDDGDGLSALASAFPGILDKTVVMALPPHPPPVKRVRAVVEKPFELDRLLRVAVDCCLKRNLHPP